VVLIVPLLRFALSNHRSIDTGVRRAWRQLGVAVVGFVMLSVVAFTAAQMLALRR
jgi:hypothetical protein